MLPSFSFLQNVISFLPDYVALHPWEQYSSELPLRETQILQKQSPYLELNVIKLKYVSCEISYYSSVQQMVVGRVV